ncbi:large-conductance mechanosensitive channel protein MscL [Paraflavitalea sp. CAU 1676]|uniref:large-conductance mechanosensitive channel protein MscL n=1 Tax=Paraflavitalea sp. CAU 1676 TaxID=3032598 RepID=UPI0023D9DEB0|nr:large-conductance mechanosensitive channel protein MscL [Paraflavitalea sp. CAU 1676]MDF2187108.1 large-conductance mechanosensitive channel protein MscL [Paraflavitalea sp. CAU 1676]
MGMVSEFKQFAMKGNVVDLAVGVIIGAAFGKIVSSLVDDVITPLILKPLLEAAHLNKLEDLTMFGTVKYGVFISAVLNFIIVAFVLFLLIKGINRMKKKEEEAPAAPPAPTTSEKLLAEIRDELKRKG